jgi:hypothetical protein
MRWVPHTVRKWFSKPNKSSAIVETDKKTKLTEWKKPESNHNGAAAPVAGISLFLGLISVLSNLPKTTNVANTPSGALNSLSNSMTGTSGLENQSTISIHIPREETKPNFSVDPYLVSKSGEELVFSPSDSTSSVTTSQAQAMFSIPEDETKLSYSLLKAALDRLPNEAFISKSRFQDALQTALAEIGLETREDFKPKWTLTGFSLEFEINQSLKLPFGGEFKSGKINITKYAIFAGVAWGYCKSKEMAMKDCIEFVTLKIIKSLEEIPIQFR